MLVYQDFKLRRWLSGKKRIGQYWKGGGRSRTVGCTRVAQFYTLQKPKVPSSLGYLCHVTQSSMSSLASLFKGILEMFLVNLNRNFITSFEWIYSVLAVRGFFYIFITNQSTCLASVIQKCWIIDEHSEKQFTCVTALDYLDRVELRQHSGFTKERSLEILGKYRIKWINFTVSSILD